MIEVAQTQADLREELSSPSEEIFGEVKSPVDGKCLENKALFQGLLQSLPSVELNAGGVESAQDIFRDEKRRKCCYLLQTYPAASALHYIISFNPHNNSMKKYYYPHFMREETGVKQVAYGHTAGSGQWQCHSSGLIFLLLQNCTPD